MSELKIEQKIIEIIENISVEYWNNCSRIETPKMTKEESEFSNHQNDKAAKEIIKLFKNK